MSNEVVPVNNENAAVETEAAVEPVKAVEDEEVLEINLDHFTVNEIETIEDIIDGSIDSLSDPRARKAKMIRAVATVMKRRENPDVTDEEIGRLKIKFADNAGEVPPTDATG